MADEEPDLVDHAIARVARAYEQGTLAPVPEAPDELDQEDLDALLRMAKEHGALTGKVAGLASQVRSLRASLRGVLSATGRYSDSRRATWWLEAHRALRRSR